MKQERFEKTSKGGCQQPPARDAGIIKSLCRGLVAGAMNRGGEGRGGGGPRTEGSKSLQVANLRRQLLSSHHRFLRPNLSLRIQRKGRAIPVSPCPQVSEVNSHFGWGRRRWRGLWDPITHLLSLDTVGGSGHLTGSESAPDLLGPEEQRPWGW